MHNIIRQYYQMQELGISGLCLYNSTVSQHPCHSRGQPVAERQRDNVVGSTAAGNWPHLVQNPSLVA